ncbi:MAG TPA: hypothetical protein VGD49_03740 [Longimicrobiales bacterium]
MARYKYEEHLKLSDDAEFDRIHGASTLAPRAGIYRCDGCNREIALSQASAFPARDHHEHDPSQGPVQWRLTVLAE